MNDGTPLLRRTPSPPSEQTAVGDPTLADADRAPTGMKHIRSLLVRRGSSLVEPFGDDTGSYQSIKSGLSTIVIIGTCIGLLMPQNTNLPTPWYRILSSAIGYTYFLAWSVSFYPQVVQNCRRRSTVGLSTDFTVINLFGYICYTCYTTTLFWSSGIHEEYRRRYGPEAKNTVQSNDVAFAIHALVLSFVWVAQIYRYDGFKTQPLSKPFQIFLLVVVFTCLSFAIAIRFRIGGYGWLDFVYLLSCWKVIITISKYVPQVLLNYRRKSTEGWSPWNVTLDISGGGLSLLQLVLDSIDLKDWSGVTGNLAKLGLSLVTIFFDIIFLTQHYILYPRQ
eukprot:CAMPEP_0197720146 /NCGR_PEP_ID=MMETSP1434-20131217/3597_1 /TAXON_ID=265543 /ORGANISM="Minutocellus polymorphus, Strain CCMP3303" /LENGTH=334 /DNA_ID=CAMNT_0043304959 /DNA_START=40 /DNA_END=1044 /DNA_ORIENTATION=-